MTFTPTNQFISHKAIFFLTNPKVPLTCPPSPSPVSFKPFEHSLSYAHIPGVSSSHSKPNELQNARKCSVVLTSVPSERSPYLNCRKFLTVVFFHFSLFVSIPCLFLYTVCFYTFLIFLYPQQSCFLIIKFQEVKLPVWPSLSTNTLRTVLEEEF